MGGGFIPLILLQRFGNLLFPDEYVPSQGEGGVFFLFLFRRDDPDLHVARPPRMVFPRGKDQFFPLSRKDRKSTRLNSSHVKISYAVFCLKKKKKKDKHT